MICVLNAIKMTKLNVVNVFRVIYLKAIVTLVNVLKDVLIVKMILLFNVYLV